jgi:hypothetical protein
MEGVALKSIKRLYVTATLPRDTKTGKLLSPGARGAQASGTALEEFAFLRS